jgi:c-di-GMP-binding flagellar brake protein YcgR
LIVGTQLFLDTLPAALDGGTQDDPWFEFRVTAQAEVVTLLRQLRDSSVPINLTPVGGGAPYCTTLWALDTSTGRISFSASDSVAGLKELLACGQGVAVAYLESVKVQFDVQGLTLVKGVRASALMCAAPTVVYRFQRREHFRVRTDPRQSPRGLGRHPGRPELSVALRVLDVSAGGCGLLVPPEAPPIRAGSVMQQVRFELDSEARFIANVAVRHVAEIRGGGGVRLGCEWEQVDIAGRRTLQRYIEMMQKRRRLLSLI